MKKFLSVFLASLLFAASLFLFGCGKDGEGGEGGEPFKTDKAVGISYSTWFPPLTGNKWGTPVLGEYNSSDEAVIEQHAKWLSDAGIDFIMIDWTNNMTHEWGVNDNNLYWIEAATETVYKVFSRVENAPKIVIAGGVNSADQAICFADGTMKRRADEIWERFYNNPEYSDLVFYFKGKPLLPLYLSTPAVAAKPGDKIYQDDRFTVRFFTGFLGQQPNLVKEGTRISKYGYWSWWERGDNVYAVNDDGSVEFVSVSAAWVGEMPADQAQTNPNAAWDPKYGARGRENGQTFLDQWELAIGLDPELILVQSFNEWVSETLPGKAAEEMNPEFSNDIEPSVELGYTYLNLMKEQIYRFKAGI